MEASSKMRSSCAAGWSFAIVLGLAAVVSSSEAYVFYAGGRDGWVLDPAESFNHWAERNRFQVNDTIVFTHGEGAGEVLQVTEPDYDACSTRSPVRRLEDAGDGRSVFLFDRSGPFFFISGDEERCQKGQKLYIIVMAVRPTKQAAEAPEPSAGSSQTGLPAFPPAGATTAPPPIAGSSQTGLPAFSPAGATPAPPPLWASAPENAEGPGVSALGAPEIARLGAAPPPTSGAAGLDGVIVGAVVGMVGALVF